MNGKDNLPHNITTLKRLATSNNERKYYYTNMQMNLIIKCALPLSDKTHTIPF